MESAGVDDPVSLEIGWLEEKAFIPTAEDGALAAFVDDDEGLRAGSVRDGDEAGVDAGPLEFALVEAAGIVFADFADVAGDESPGLAGDDWGTVSLPCDARRTT